MAFCASLENLTTAGANQPLNVQKEDDQHQGVRLEPPHRFAARGEDITLTIAPRGGQEKLLIRAHTHEPLVLIRKQVSMAYCLKSRCGSAS